MSIPADPVVEIEFDCLPLRSVARLDVPLDASDEQRRRTERIKAAIDQHGVERTYYLDHARCVYRFANSEIEGICRFQFEGVVRTDASDHKCDEAILDVQLVSDTCGGIPSVVVPWLVDRVRQAVTIEFDRFIAAGELARLAVAEDLGGI
jgi:hypothetical protein